MALVKSEYSPTGYTIVTDEPGTRREPTQAERDAAAKADLITYDAVIADVFNGDPAAFEAARAFNFPLSVGRRAPRGGWSVGAPLWSRKQIAKWVADVRRVAASLKGAK
jgi:hypothetical protein